MRWRLTIALALLAAGLLAASLVGSASSAPNRADLTVSDLAEPPDFAAPGSRLRQAFSVANQGNRGAGKSTTTRFFLDLNPNNSAGRRSLGRAKVGRLGDNDEQSRRARLSIPAGLATGNYFLVACADTAKKLKEAKEKNNCRVSGQTVGVGLSDAGPQGPRGTGTQGTVDRFTLPIGRATMPGFYHSSDTPSHRGRELGFEGDDEKSTQRREFARIGPISLVADCKRTTNGEGRNSNTFNSQSAPPDAPFTQPNFFDQNGDEAKILVYTENGTVTFNSLGESSRRNVGPGEGGTIPNSPAAPTQADENNGGEGTHQAIATARDPEQDAPERDWAFAYKVGSIYINHSSGLQLIFTGYAGIDVLGVGDQCVFGGVLKVAKAA